MRLAHTFRFTVVSALIALTSAAHSADKLKVGFLTTLSGPGAAAGQEVRDGFALAVKLNGGSLGGLPAEVTVVDDQQNPETGRQAVERLLKRDKVDVMTGIVYSNVLLPVLPTILGNDTVYLSTNTGPADYAGAKCNRNFYAVAWQNEDVPQAMGRFAMSKGYKRVALIAPNYPGGRESLGGFKRQYTGEIVEEIYTKLNQLDYAAELATLRASKADAVFFFLPGGQGINFIKQFASAGLSNAIALLAPGFSADEDTIKGIGEPIVGLFNASQWASDLPNPANQQFVSEFNKAYGRTPTMFASQGYDAAMLINSAVKGVAGKIENRDAFRAALRKADFNSVRGSFAFNNNQYPIHDIYMRVVQKDAAGKIGNKLVGTVLAKHSDPFASECVMK